MTVPLLGLGMLGVALIRSAVKHRNEGWVTGLILGAVLAIAGIGGAATVMFRSL